jgi:hypothetical protein
LFNLDTLAKPIRPSLRMPRNHSDTSTAAPVDGGKSANLGIDSHLLGGS